jgi:predicted ribosome quality control (RQC) complex YloA/Tae2 family protein
LDRLFLRGVVEELSPSVSGKRIRSAGFDRARSLLSLTLGGAPAVALNWSLRSEAAGPFLGPPRAEGITSPGLRNRVVSAIVAALSVSELDRVVTLSLERVRVSGRRSRSRLVLEVASNRADLFLVDSESSRVIETFSTSPPRLGAGEIYEERRPPPGAAPEARDAAEFERRLSEAGARAPESRRSALLRASGFTPLLAREMEWLIEHEGRTEGEAFETIRRSLEERRPVLYEAPPGQKAARRTCVLSPLALRSERELAPRPMGTFSEALAEAVALSAGLLGVRAARARIGGAVTRKLDRSTRLRDKLAAEEARLANPGDLRRSGENLLAGLAQARRTADGRRVVVPDRFDPGEREVEIEIDPRFPLPRNAERLFARARKEETAREKLATRIAALDAAISYWEGFACDLRDATELSELEALEQEAREQGLLRTSEEESPKRARPVRSERSAHLRPRKFRSHRGHVILVGRSGRSNDETTFRIAGPEDLWFHAAGIPGAHVVLRRASGSDSDDRDLEEAAALAAYFSKGREDSRVEVLFTERRNVSKIRGGPPGLVRVANAKSLRVRPQLLPEEREEASGMMSATGSETPNP